MRNEDQNKCTDHEPFHFGSSNAICCYCGKILHEQWTEQTLRRWAETFDGVGFVQAKQVLALLDEVEQLRKEKQ